MNVEQMATGLIKKQGLEKAASLVKDLAAINGTDKESAKTQLFWKNVAVRVTQLSAKRAEQKAQND
jgi:hypothetical protein